MDLVYWILWLSLGKLDVAHSLTLHIRVTLGLGIRNADIFQHSTSTDIRSKCESGFDGILPFDVALFVQRLGLINSVIVDVTSIF